jgi:anthranilate synthase component II
MHILLIDNYDSFTWNLVHLVASRGVEVEVVRNDALTVEQIMDMNPDALMLSPGPCTPKEAGICVSLIEATGHRIPLFGVCLGLQSIGEALGGKVVRADVPMHGKVSQIEHHGASLFRGINGPIEAARYHSLVIEAASCPTELDVTARTSDGLIMAASHRHWPLHGVQFHPESIASQHGATIVQNFLDMARTWNKTQRQGACDGSVMQAALASTGS